MTVDPEARLKNNPALRARQSKQADLVSPALGLSKAEAILAQQLYGKKPQVQRVFQILDKDGSGALSIGELQGALAQFDLQLGAKELDMLIARYDNSGDGEVSWKEFMDSIGSFLEKTPANDRNLGIDLMGHADEDDKDALMLEEAATGAEGEAVLVPRAKQRGDAAWGKSGAARGIGDPGYQLESKSSEDTGAAGGVSGSHGGSIGGLATSPMRRGSRPGSRSSRPGSAAASVFGGRPAPGDDDDMRSVASRAAGARARRGSAGAGAQGGRGRGGDAGLGLTLSGGHAGGATGHVRAVRAGTLRRKLQTTSDGRTVSSVDMEATEEKMRRILGRSWQGIYNDVRKVGARGQGQAMQASVSQPQLGRSSGGGGVGGSGGAFGGTSLRFGGGGALP